MARSLLVALLLVAPTVLALTPPADAPQALAEARAREVLEGRAFLGSTPQGWIDWARAQLASPQPVADAGADLGLTVRALYAAAGVQADAATLEALDGSLAALDVRQAAATGALVAAAARAYAAQAAVVERLDLDAAARGDSVLAEADALASLARAEELRVAAGAFRAAIQDIPTARLQDWSDPLGLVVVGGPGDNTFARTPGNPFAGDPVVLADTGGDDLDLTAAGGACPVTLALVSNAARCNGLALALRVDVAGHDTYSFTTLGGVPPVVQGSGAFGGLGVLVDFEGDDRYLLRQHVTRTANILSYITGVAQGSGEGGVGLLLDLDGSDLYEIRTTGIATLWMQAQGFAGVGGIGALLDAAGDDTYDGSVDCSAAARGRWCGVYLQGTAIYPGVGLIVDAAGNDVYRGFVTAPQMDYYSQGFGAFGGLGVQVDLLGDDTYYDSARSTDGTFAVSLNCAYGTAFYAGGGVFLDLDGDDSYFSETISTNRPFTMAEGFSYTGSVSLFWDVRGDDVHHMVATGPAPLIAGRGYGTELLDNVLMVYLDTGGNDSYLDSIGSNNNAWTAGPFAPVGIGVDVNAVP